MKYIKWLEPVPGRDALGNEVTVTRIVYMTVEDAAQHGRAIGWPRSRRERPGELAEDVLVCNWGEYVETEHLP